MIEIEKNINFFSLIINFKFLGYYIVFFKWGFLGKYLG